MENILDTYQKPLCVEYPVLCFDERPCQLIDDIAMPLPTKRGSIKKEDYHYKRNGTCAVLLAIEPLTGKRIVEISSQKTKVDYARFMEKVVKNYPKAKKIKLVQDNLNTHNPSSFYENMAPQKAFELMCKIEMLYTPKKASWLNMAEIEFSALSKQCLDRRIGSIEELPQEVLAWSKKRSIKKIKISWQFTKEKARVKLGKHYG